VVSENGVDYFVKPHSFQEPFAEFVEYLRAPVEESAAVKYAQSREFHVNTFFFIYLQNLALNSV
jgi:hypothetical protein